MTRPSRTRRILKWAGVGLSFVVLTTWVGSLWCQARLLINSSFLLGIDCGNIGVMRGNFDFVKTFPPSGMMSSGLDWHVARDGGFNLPTLFRELPVNVHNLSQRYSMDFVPLWRLLLVTALPTAWLWHRDRRRIRPGCCLRCGYDLTGNTSGVCSECGLPKPPPATL